MRLVAGSLKGRVIEAPPGRNTRPTADRARESLFNILAHSPLVDLDGALVLDAFAGSGGLGFEALSRGAARCWFLEKHGPTAAVIERNARALGVTERVTVLKADATRPPPAPQPCDLLLLDAPYEQNLSAPALAALAEKGWLAESGLAVVEVAAKEAFTPPSGFLLEDERIVGAARFLFLTRGQAGSI